MSFKNHNLESFISNHHKDGHLFLLVDGAQIDHGQVPNIEGMYGDCIYLFKGTYEEEAYLYGPILFDLSQLNLKQVDNQIKLMKSKDSMILIKSKLETNQLKNKLLEKLYIELDDGGIGILRYYDPRVLNRLSLIFTSDQKKQLLDGFESIFFMLNELSYELKYND
ncbi:DUF4123 domain-containing protein [Acinetobacter nosocomialis]|uniref:DUF4123 domain-containing protein n=1 Tax=Acinetobacter nosocomialis TaxID=106654 RepID=UPI00244C2B2E|nr:DUF4123 domain-containing protein [Acinetobacter nosocomialis]MDH2636872.1 DUF4123 domain-containing protein [Acinetobacter nosocomialis]